MSEKVKLLKEEKLDLISKRNDRNTSKTMRKKIDARLFNIERELHEEWKNEVAEKYANNPQPQFSKSNLSSKGILALMMAMSLSLSGKNYE